jgi:quinol monooxygenase YgiN
MAAHTVEISTGTAVITLINTFTVAPEKQDELVAALVRATEEVMRQLPGFVSASIHQSVDGTRVANYAQWASQAHFEAMLKNDEARAHMTEAAKLAVKFEPLLYHVVSVHKALGPR